MSDNDHGAIVPDISPEEAATKFVKEHDVAAVDMCAVAVLAADKASDDVAIYHWLRVTREVVRRLIAEREELGG